MQGPTLLASRTVTNNKHHPVKSRITMSDDHATSSAARRWPEDLRRSTPLHAHWDMFSGVAGDMMLAACLDASGDDSDCLRQEITDRLTKGLPALAGEFRIHLKQVWRSSGSIGAKHVEVESLYGHSDAPVPEPLEEGESQEVHGDDHEVSLHDTSTAIHAHTHNHDHHSHEHNHHHHHNHQDVHVEKHSNNTSSPNGPLRNLPEIRTMLNDADESFIPSWVKQVSIQAFTELADAEATVHCAKSMDHVHFHEVGAVDSIVDTVGTVLAIYLLGATTFSCSAFPLGQGMVRTAHGLLPVPAPATLRLLLDMPTTRGPPGAYGELVTPTGAALVRTLVRNYPPPTASSHKLFAPPNMVLQDIGVGAGTKDFKSHANILRLMLGKLAE